MHDVELELTAGDDKEKPMATHELANKEKQIYFNQTW
jgi:hypothetical protein